MILNSDAPLTPRTAPKIEPKSDLKIICCLSFGIKFQHRFSPCLFSHIFGFSSDLGLHLASILASFSIFLHSFFGHRFCIDFELNFHAFLSAQNHVFYCKTNSFEHFSLFQKSLNFHRFWPPFWHHFGSLVALIFNTFSASIFACLFGCIFFDFWS